MNSVNGSKRGCKGSWKIITTFLLTDNEIHMQFMQAGQTAQQDKMPTIGKGDGQPSFSDFVTSVSKEMDGMTGLVTQAVGHVQKQGGETTNLQQTSASMKEASETIKGLKAAAHANELTHELSSTAPAENSEAKVSPVTFAENTLADAKNALSETSKLMTQHGMFKHNSSGALQSTSTSDKVTPESSNSTPSFGGSSSY